MLTLLQDPLCGSRFHSRPGPKADLEGARALGNLVLQVGLALVHGSWLFAPSFGLDQAAALVC